MKNILYILTFVFALVLITNTNYSQNSTIDSLERVLAGMPDDTNKVNKIIEFLDFQSILDSSYLPLIDLTKSISSKENYNYGLKSYLTYKAKLCLLYSDLMEFKKIIKETRYYQFNKEADKLTISLISVETDKDSLVKYYHSLLNQDIENSEKYYIKSVFYRKINKLDSSMKYLEILYDDKQGKYFKDALYDFIDVARLMNKFNLSNQLIEEKILLQKKNNDTNGLEISYIDLATNYSILGDIDSTKKYFLKAEEIIKKKNNKTLLFAVELNLFILEFKEGNESKILKRLKKLFDLYEYYEQELLVKFLYWDTYQKYNLDLKEIPYRQNFENFVKECLASKYYKETSSITDLYKLAADVFEKDRLYNKSLEYFKLHVKLNDSLQSDNSKKMIASFKVEYETEKIEAQNQLLAKENDLKDANLAKEKQLKWFVGGGAGLLLFFGLFTFLRYRKRQKLQAEKQQLKTEKEIVELEQKLLLTQMNPHFIFNSLNSIKSYILQNESTKANEYLGDFAKLMRLILDSSRKKSIPLEDEVEMLRYYLNLEQLRLKEKLNFTISINSELEKEIEEINIPPMLLQPYVENAIKHGISNKMGAGHITLSFDYKNENQLKIDIQDNGIGRKKAQEIKALTKQTHESVAISITQERINTFNKENKETTPIEVNIVDLFNEVNEPQGTKVSFITPVLSV